MTTCTQSTDVAFLETVASRASSQRMPAWFCESTSPLPFLVTVEALQCCNNHDVINFQRSRIRSRPLLKQKCPLTHWMQTLAQPYATGLTCHLSALVRSNSKPSMARGLKSHSVRYVHRDTRPEWHCKVLIRRDTQTTWMTSL